MDVNIFFKSSLMSRTCLDTLIMNFIKTTVYVYKETLKVLKKTRQLDNLAAEEGYCREVEGIGMNSASYPYRLMDL